jgi:hypothetical protein
MLVDRARVREAVELLRGTGWEYGLQLLAATPSVEFCVDGRARRRRPEHRDVRRPRELANRESRPRKASAA